ncbi:MAG: tetrapyrrole methylase family protein / MazG family protein [Halanaerobium sp. 4-GBenrich]|uniref:Tetrapyrrole methylase family protein / MazG family protein n=1 Tax=Halanaerobium congolense TaxID=54121 RepID=A0A1G6LNT5_9FIRM|nr:nucleoside triphosphate pyrophosphohydrolase [Halanaerobium congolense]KXS49750.1 MAG: tetrapyrrole methylase family protein / MazG family protein [Halanaerobium sp. T82-1]ODS49872.1 MAG: tetrapyrrole methylase family protein / MazG family protein [Halanaerobium sp. 4-GBenrich]PUU93100.1 MAG: tetrapyrrole methylase family protein / MazG family protein [Halanaerobium sp.]PTX15635.1 tetrapyrrole methylase family protein/MazG family protein [Halanaerobium congolense]PXV68737.1 tetrapyrrole met
MEKDIRNEILEELDQLIKVMAVLRGPGGCPWDKKQDYYSIKENIIEEAYEVVEALEKNDIPAFKEELGDLLLQVVFESQIAYEKNDFNLGDVAKVLREKLIRRHPHVFAELDVSGSDEVLKNWEKIKQKEKGKKNQLNSLLDKFNQGQSALNQAYDIQKIAAEVGFDWNDLRPVIDKIEEELSECKEIIAVNPDNTTLSQSNLDKKDKDKLESEIGDLLFAVVNFARFNDINPEIALLKTIFKFKDRFAFIENRVKKNNNDFEDYNLEQLDEFWNQAKKEE